MLQDEARTQIVFDQCLAAGNVVRDQNTERPEKQVDWKLSKLG